MTINVPRMLDWSINQDGVQIYRSDRDTKRGWGVYNCACDQCGREWVAVANVGTFGRECPTCGDVLFEKHWGDERGV